MNNNECYNFILQVMTAAVENWEQGYVYILCVLGRGVTLLQVQNMVQRLLTL